MIIKEELSQNIKKGKKINLNIRPKEINTINWLIHLLNDRLNKFTLQIYFNKYKLIKQKKACELTLEQINLELNLFKDFKVGDQIDIFQYNFPEVVTPEFISGCTYSERAEKLKQYITYFSEEKKDCEYFLSKSSFVIQDDIGKDYLDEIEERIEKYEDSLFSLNELIDIKWIPLPLVIESDKKIKDTNKNIPKNTIRIIYNDISNNKKRYLILKLEKNKNIKLEQTKKGKNSNQFDWLMNENEFNKIHNSSITFSIYENNNNNNNNNMDKDDFISEFVIRLLPLRYKNNFSYEYEKKNVKEKKTEFTILIKTRNSYEDLRNILEIKEIYPKFEFVDEFITIEHRSNYNIHNSKLIANNNILDEEIGGDEHNNNKNPNLKDNEKINDETKVNNEVNNIQNLNVQIENLKKTIANNEETINKERKKY